MRLTCMSYNVLHFEKWRTGEIDYDAFADVIRQSGADIVGLNEVYGASDLFGAQAEKLAARLGWHAYFAEGFLDDDTDPFGNAVVSRFPIDEAQNIRIPYPEVRLGTAYYEPRCVHGSRDIRFWSRISGSIPTSGKTRSRRCCRCWKKRSAC